ERYSDGLSHYDVEQSRVRGVPFSAEDSQNFGRVNQYEMYNSSSIGANLVHYWVGMEGQGPFGRPPERQGAPAGHGYDEGLTRAGMNVREPTKLILFGDGHGDAE